MKCSFCGFEFLEQDAHSCSSCPLKISCGKIQCPNCGYEMPKENFFWKRFRHRKRGSAGKKKRHQGQLQRAGHGQEIMLTELEEGETAVVSRIKTTDTAILNKLMALGILPGMKVTMIQKFPSFVFQVGNTRVTADEEITGSVLVHI
jgi:Fe2+ transport system protein FeoA